MNRQIRFFLCDAMRTAIEAEAHRIGANLVSSNAWGTDAIEFSTSSGTDHHRGRLWTEAGYAVHYEALRRAVKRGAVYDRDSMLWVKKPSLPAFHSYRAKRQRELSDLVEENRRYAIEVLGARSATNRT
jgi:hypothetical protein